MLKKLVKKLKRKILNIRIAAIAKKTGRKPDDIKKDMRRAKKRFGVSYKEFMARKLYLKSFAEIKKIYVPEGKKRKQDMDIALVAEVKGISRDAAKAEMDVLRDKYGILYKEYTQYKLFSCTTEEELAARVQHILEKDEKYIREVCDDTGWNFEKAKAEAERIKKTHNTTIKHYSRYRFYSMSDDEIKAKLKSWKNDGRHYVDIAVAESGWSRNKVRYHMKRCQVLYDIINAYYVLYRCWELTDEEIDSYARQKNSETLWTRYNDAEQARILAEKHRFDEVYSEYTGRRFWINRDSSFEQFREFAEGLDSVFCKPIESGGGLGTEKYEVTEDLRGLYELLTGKERLLVEECIKQHPAVDEFVPGCCCTVRVVVLQDEEGTHTICAGMRFGHDGITDNFSHDGMVADVDIETGTIITDAVDKKGRVYEKHPVSGKTFKGFIIPNWSLVREVTEKSMDVLPGINYVGWDVAICEDKAVLVEGNAMPDLVLIQAPYAPVKKGMKYLFDPWLNK